MANVQPKLPASICDPCEVAPDPSIPFKTIAPRTVTTTKSNFASMIQNMTAEKACAVWPPAGTPE